MSFRSALARTASFAHLPGFSPRAARKADKRAAKPAADDEEEDMKKAKTKSKADDDDYDGKKAKDGEDDAEGDPDEDGDEDTAKRGKAKQAKAKRASDRERDNESDEDDDDEDDDDEDDDGDDESDEDEMRGKKGRRAASARQRERARCAAIFASPGAAANPRLAAHYAFKTRMARGEAIAALKEAVASIPAAGLAARMEREATPRIRGGSSDAGEAGRAASVAKSWDDAFARVKRK